MDGDTLGEKVGVDSLSVSQGTVSRSSFTCACCHEIYVLPTTLTCGHNFCRHCVATWYLTNPSKEKTCPSCRQVWIGSPKVNLTIKEIIETSFPEEHRLRTTELQADPEYRKTLQNFDDATVVRGIKRYVQHRRQPIPMPWIYFGIVLGIVGVILVFVCGFLSLWPSESTLATKWTEEEVITWLHTLGPWVNENITEAFHKRKINGYFLTNLEESDIVDIINSSYSAESSNTTGDVLFTEQQNKMTKDLSRTLFLAIFELKTLQTKPPTTFWEYKNMHTTRTLLLFLNLDECPRLTYLYLYLYDYKDVILPLVHSQFPVLEKINYINLYTYPFPDLDNFQCFKLLITWILCPFLLPVMFTWNIVVGFNLIFGLWLLVYFSALAVVDWSFMYRQYKGFTLTKFAQDFKSNLWDLLMSCLTMLIGSCLPTFILNLIFIAVLIWLPLARGKLAVKILHQLL